MAAIIFSALGIMVGVVVVSWFIAESAIEIAWGVMCYLVLDAHREENDGGGTEVQSC